MTYQESHTINIPPITLPAGVEIAVSITPGTGGQQAVQITGTTASSKADTVALLQEAFALLMTAASAEGIGRPIFVGPPPPTVAP